MAACGDGTQQRTSRDEQHGQPTASCRNRMSPLKVAHRERLSKGRRIRDLRRASFLQFTRVAVHDSLSDAQAENFLRQGSIVFGAIAGRCVL